MNNVTPSRWLSSRRPSVRSSGSTRNREEHSNPCTLGRRRSVASCNCAAPCSCRRQGAGGGLPAHEPGADERPPGQVEGSTPLLRGEPARLGLALTLRKTRE